MKGFAISPRPKTGHRAPLFAAAILDPAQFRDIWSGAGHSPERELAAAVLDAAVVDLQKYRYARSRSRQRLYWQAYQWVASADREWPFSFVNACESLRLSPEALRAQLLGTTRCGTERASGVAPRRTEVAAGTLRRSLTDGVGTRRVEHADQPEWR